VAVTSGRLKTKAYKNRAAKGGRYNLFRFFMESMLLAGIAILLHFQPFLQDFLILVGKIVDGFALSAFQLDHVVLGHKNHKQPKRDSLKT